MSSFGAIVRGMAAVIAVGALALTATAQSEDGGMVPTGRIGVGLEGPGGRSLSLVDAAKTSTPWRPIGEGELPKDEHGWPLADAQVVFFDLRPTYAWAPPADDPDAYQIDVSGTYKLSFTGKADLSSVEEPASWHVENQQYDPATNRTTADVVMHAGGGLLYVRFTNTDGGVKDVRLIRPGYPADTQEVFHRPFLEALAPFPVLRFMDYTHTNNDNPPFDAADNVTDWADRKQPDDATMSADTTGDGRTSSGAAWEYVVELANACGKDIWINVPVAASDDYVHQLAELLCRRLRPKVAVYFEYSNETWHAGFDQGVYNRKAAAAEVARGESNLNYDGRDDVEVLNARRHARRTLEMGQIFAEVFGADSMGTRVRPVLSWTKGQPAEIADMLKFVTDNYGPPADYFQAIATTAYITYGRPDPEDTVDDVLDQMLANADRDAPRWDAVADLCDEHGLELYVYEGGSNTAPGFNHTNTAIAARIGAERSKRIAQIIQHHIRDNFFARGGDLFMYFTLSSAYSRHGCWGLTDDITQPRRNHKYQAVVELIEQGRAAQANPAP